MILSLECASLAAKALVRKDKVDSFYKVDEQLPRKFEFQKANFPCTPIAACTNHLV